MGFTLYQKEKRGVIFLLSLLLLLTIAAVQFLSAQEENNVSRSPDAAAAAPVEAEPSVSHSFLELVKAGGWIGVIILILSLWACAEAIRLFFILRRQVILPPPLQEEWEEKIKSGNLRDLVSLCQEYPSFLASVLADGLQNSEEGWQEIEKGLEERLESETARLYRKTDFLVLVGNIAPMLGLLGTVLGMVAAFGELAVSEGLGRFANLAQGIYLALVTTVDGLLAAIPALALSAFFNHRIAELSSEAAEAAERLTLPLKGHYRKRVPTVLPVRPVPSRTAEGHPVPPPLPRAHKDPSE